MPLNKPLIAAVKSDEEIANDRTYIPPKRKAIIKTLANQPANLNIDHVITHQLEQFEQFEKKYRFIKEYIARGGLITKQFEAIIEEAELYVNRLRRHTVCCLKTAGYNLLPTSKWEDIKRACMDYRTKSITRHPNLNCKEALEAAESDLMKILKFVAIPYKEVESIIDQMVEFEDKYL